MNVNLHNLLFQEYLRVNDVAHFETNSCKTFVNDATAAVIRRGWKGLVSIDKKINYKRECPGILSQQASAPFFIYIYLSKQGL